MSAALQFLASRRLAAGRERALKTHHELEGTLELIQRAEEEHRVVFPWMWRECKSQIPSKEEIKRADYLATLRIEAAARATNSELLEKALTSANKRLDEQKEAVSTARKAIEIATEDHNRAVNEARNILMDGGAGKHIALPEKSILPPFEGLGIILGAISAFVGGSIFISIVFGSYGDMWASFPILCIALVAPLYLFPQLLCYLSWKLRCRDAVASAKAHAQKADRIAKEKYQEHLPKLQQSLAVAEESLQSAGLAQVAIKTRLEKASKPAGPVNEG